MTFSYEVEGEYYGGRFSIVGGEHSDTPYSAGKKIIVGSNPHHPEQNYPQGIADQQALAFKILFAVMICLFALIIFVNLIGKK